MSSVVKQLSFITALSQFPLDGWRFLALVFCVIMDYYFFCIQHPPYQKDYIRKMCDQGSRFK